MAADLIRYEIVYNFGGLYIDFKFEGLRPADALLKYESIFLDIEKSKLRFRPVHALGVGVIGSVQNNYYLKILMMELINNNKVKFESSRIPIETGGFVARQAFSEE
jgi:mannosyltransferase OCH1-like enzyme